MRHYFTAGLGAQPYRTVYQPHAEIAAFSRFFTKLRAKRPCPPVVRAAAVSRV
jgi:hypothetical protein